MSAPNEAERREALRRTITQVLAPCLMEREIRGFLAGARYIPIGADEIDRLLTWHLAELDKALGTPPESTP